MNLYVKALLASTITVSVISYAEPAAVTLYLLGYDLPDEQRMSVVDQDIEAFRSYQKKRIEATFLSPANEDTPKSKRETFSSINTNDLKLCDFKDIDNCLTQIDTDAKPYHSAIKMLKPVFEDIDKLRLADSSELKSVFPSNLQLMSTPIPPYQLLTNTLLTKNVIAYHDNPQQALTQICEDVAFGKSIVRSQQSLIQSMIGTMIVHSQLDLLSKSSQSLPQNCQEALKPMDSAGTSMCSLVASESRQMANEMMAVPRTPILFNRLATLEQIVKGLQPYCNKERIKLNFDDQLMPIVPQEEYNPIFFNKIGGILLNIARPDYRVYQQRLQDANARLQLWQAALNPQCSNDSERYINLIAKNWQPTRRLRLDNQRLAIDNYDKNAYPQLSVECRKFAQNSYL